MTDAERWHEVARLYEAALERHGEDRTAFLEDACAGDDALRKEVQSLLNCDVETEQFMAVPAVQVLANSITRDGRTSLVGPPLGGQVGPYRILEVLGEGGMGVVYRAEQERPLRRHVALKVIKLGLDTPSVVSRFNAERQALALMEHPNVAAVLDAGATVDGRPYFVMEYVPGQPITDYCDSHQMSTRERLELFTQVCGAVEHAHQRGLIHRDIKPSNVLVTMRDGQPLPKVIDFGVAKATREDLTERTLFTEAGVLIGTPEYMSPEQAEFDSRDIDTRTDVYALGVLLYELLVGAVPFESARLRRAALAEMLRIIREEEPARPSIRLTALGDPANLVAVSRHTTVSTLARQLRGDLDWITLKALEKDRRRRYASVSELAADVGRHLADVPVVARPPEIGYRMQKFVKRHRISVAASAAVLAAIVAALITSTAMYVRADRARRDSDAQRRESNERRLEAETERTRADNARQDADAQRRDAVQQAEAAIAANTRARQQRLEAEYRAYAATIGAADAELRAEAPSAARMRLLSASSGLRGWEWRHLFLRTDSSLAQSEWSHPPGSPNRRGNTLSVDAGGMRVYLRRDTSLDVWDAPTRRHLATYSTAGPILAVDPEGRTVIAVQRDSQWDVQLTEPASGRVVRSVGPFSDQPRCADFSARSGRLVVGLIGDRFQVWDLAGGRLLVQMTHPHAEPPGPRPRCLVALSPDGSSVASSGTEIFVWKAAPGTEITAKSQSGGGSTPVVFTPDGRRVLVAAGGEAVEILSAERTPSPNAGPEFWYAGGDRASVSSMVFSTDGRFLVSGSAQDFTVWDVSSKRQIGWASAPDAQFDGMAFSADGAEVISVDVGGRLRVWSSAFPGFVSTLADTEPEISTSVAVSADGRFVAVPNMRGAVAIWRLADGRKMSVAPGPTGSCWAALLTSTGSRLVSAHDNGEIRVWDLSPDAIGVPSFFTLTDQSGVVSALALSRDDRILATGSRDRTARVWDLSTRKLLATLRLADSISAVAFRPDGTLIVGSDPFDYYATSGGRRRALPGRANPPEIVSGLVDRLPRNPTVRLWDWKAGRVRAEITAPWTPDARDGGIQSLAISPDGSEIALAVGDSSAVTVWSSDLSKEVGRLIGAGPVQALAFSPDGRRLASAGFSESIRIWDTARKELLLIMRDTQKKQHSAFVFTPDGRRLVASAGEAVNIWDSRDPASRPDGITR